MIPGGAGPERRSGRPDRSAATPGPDSQADCRPRGGLPALPKALTDFRKTLQEDTYHADKGAVGRS